MDMLKTDARSFVFLGGHALHRYCATCPKLDASACINHVLGPLLTAFLKSQHIKDFLFAPLHVILYHRNPKEWGGGQGPTEVKQYNDKTAMWCERHGVRVYNSTAVTSDIDTVDAVHHTNVVNVIKAQLLLAYMDSVA